MRIGRILTRRRSDPPAPFGIDNFTILQRDGDEIVYGLAGRFWRPDFDLAPLRDGEEFLALDQPAIAKLALNLAVCPMADGRSILSTETRVFCVDRHARVRFAPYWYLIRPVSGLIRRRILASIRKVSEGDMEQGHHRHS